LPYSKLIKYYEKLNFRRLGKVEEAFIHRNYKLRYDFFVFTVYTAWYVLRSESEQFLCGVGGKLTLEFIKRKGVI